jgi:hypothetical protein
LITVKKKTTREWKKGQQFFRSESRVEKKNANDLASRLRSMRCPLPIDSLKPLIHAGVEHFSLQHSMMFNAKPARLVSL